MKKLVEKLIDQEVFQKIAIGSNEVENYYKKNKKEFSVPDEVHCRQIIVDKKEKASTIYSLLQNGSNFQEVAQQHSEGLEKNKGGDLGWIARGQYPKVIEEACFTLAVGQTSGIISSEYGYHIFKVVEKKPGFQQSFASAKSIIEDILRHEKGSEEMEAWLDTLNQEAKISIDDRALKDVVLVP
ncbi:MAG: peptidylprolyl isomerase [Deltaproteobacteria bacterium]|nr:MAG: peptidylprolyl isomerase [Deltaproteobacteria bacterium]